MTGNEIKQRREAAGLTQQDLADRIGCRVMTVSRRERCVTGKMLHVYEERLEEILNSKAENSCVGA